MAELKELINNKTKLDQSFPNPLFQIDGYKMFRRDRGKYGGGILFYVNENIQSKVLHLNSTPGHNEVILLEFSIKGLKWLCTGVFKAPSQNDKTSLITCQKVLGGDYMIPVGRNEILSRFTGILAML